MDHEHASVDGEVSDLIVQLLQVLLAFVLGQSLIQNRALLIEVQDSDNWIGLLALLVLFVLAVESWIDWHIDVTRHPFRLEASNERRRWAMTRLWLDVGHVVSVGYLALTVAHFAGSPAASPVRHVAGHVAVHVLLLGSTLVRDKTYGSHRELRQVQLHTCAVVLAVWLIAVVLTRSSGSSVVSNAVILLAVMVANIVHHARMRHHRMLT